MSINTIAINTENYAIKKRLHLAMIIAIAWHMIILFGIHYTNAFSIRPQKESKTLMLSVNLHTPKTTTLPHKAYLLGEKAQTGDLLEHETENHISTEPIKVNNTAHTEKTLPLKKRTISAAQHQSKDAVYLKKWQNKIERFGNTHYPKQARKQQLHGDLRLLVAINKDGSVHNIILLQSSGHAILDQAAIQIVKQTMPFDPLPEQLSQEIDVLEIIRTWKFRGQLTATG